MTTRLFFALLTFGAVTAISNAQQKAWPGVEYDEVRAYCYDYTAERGSDFIQDNRLHKGVMDARGVKLSTDQTKQLVSIITTPTPKEARTRCYKPHHAFVFFKDGRSVAVFEMCFGCNRWVATPAAGVPEYIDRTALWNLTGELGLPLDSEGKGNPFFTKVVKDYRKARGQ
ncbi:MAG: hypothetical protein JNJ83_23405 [Verrucomicrobiaceae bacterium]|nr:hypothetical protein [Verrucomicrobiaceae bacterium]